MTEFKIGDRVQFSRPSGWLSDPWRPGNTGTILCKWFGGTGIHIGYKVMWDGEKFENKHHTENLTKVEPSKLAFVGPEPEDITPDVTTPFGVDSDEPHVLRDSRGNELGRILGDLTHVDQDVELAALIVDLLNAHFGVK